MDLTEKDKIDLVKQVMKLKIYEMVKSLVADDLYGLTVYQYALSMNEAIEAYKDCFRRHSVRYCAYDGNLYGRVVST